jgi:flagellar motility protein MotE (MotC chaperone)
MKRNISQLRQRIRRLEDSLAAPLKHLLAERGPLRRGSFVTLHRKCGKPTCHCAQGSGHPADYLSTRQDGRTRLIYIAAEIRDKVAEQAERYRQFRKQRAKLAQRMRTLFERIDELEEALENREPIPTTRAKRKVKKRSTKSD